ncbi:DUF202 domain-containing protein [Kiritimatiellaeota bacterium B1221]|nr:DUF202 domain-containing protein [Kiritimatiellaeota bacterium B1221]
MTKTPYSQYSRKDMILRDELAVDRTLLANERTLLAYLRSAVALIISGFSIMHFSEAHWFWWLGVACIPSGLLVGIWGAARFRMMSRAIQAIEGYKHHQAEYAQTRGEDEG